MNYLFFACFNDEPIDKPIDFFDVRYEPDQHAFSSKFVVFFTLNQLKYEEIQGKMFQNIIKERFLLM